MNVCFSRWLTLNAGAWIRKSKVFLCFPCVFYCGGLVVFTLSEMRFAASTQNGIKLRLIRADFIFSCGVEFLQHKHDTCSSKYTMTSTRQAIITTAFSTWASCLAREISTVSFSSRLPWKQRWRLYYLYKLKIYEWQTDRQSTWEREMSKRRKCPDVSLLIASSNFFPYS